MTKIFWSALAGLALSTPALAFEAQSPDIGEAPIANEFVFAGFGCSGENKSPAITWKDAPEGTKSFAVMVHDPDAPTGGAGWWHWVVYNIPATTTSLAKGAGSEGGTLPAGAMQVATDFGAPGWGGPCPPAGDKPHHYNFTVYALGVEKLEIPDGARAFLAGFMINGNAIGKASFQGTYGR
jgi:hypothetical protein